MHTAIAAKHVHIDCKRPETKLLGEPGHMFEEGLRLGQKGSRRSILVAEPANVGSVTTATLVLRALRNGFPNSRIGTVPPLGSAAVLSSPGRGM